MAGLVIADRVKETTATTGTGTLNLAGAATQFQTFIGAVGTGNQCNYCLLGGNGTDWETGIGTVTSGSPNTLSRTTVFASSNSGSLISLTGTSTVFLTEPAAALKSRIAAPIVPPTAAANWTARNSATVADVANGVSVTQTPVASGRAIGMATISSPSTPYNLDFNLSLTSVANTNTGTVGAGWTDGTKYQLVLLLLESAAYGCNVQVNNYTNATTLSADISGTFGWSGAPNDVFIRLSDDGTNVTFRISADGVNFGSLYTIAKSSGFLGSSGYTNVGFGMDAINGSSPPFNPIAVCRSVWQH